MTEFRHDLWSYDAKPFARVVHVDGGTTMQVELLDGCKPPLRGQAVLACMDANDQEHSAPREGYICVEDAGHAWILAAYTARWREQIPAIAPGDYLYAFHEKTREGRVVDKLMASGVLGSGNAQAHATGNAQAAQMLDARACEGAAGQAPRANTDAAVHTVAISDEAVKRFEDYAVKAAENIAAGLGITKRHGYTAVSALAEATQRANALADECGRLRDENRELLAENARLRRKWGRSAR